MGKKRKKRHVISSTANGFTTALLGYIRDGEEFVYRKKYTTSKKRVWLESCGSLIHYSFHDGEASMEMVHLPKDSMPMTKVLRFAKTSAKPPEYVFFNKKNV